jgi:hypothetical protein
MPMPHRNRDLDEEDNASDLGPPMDFEADAADKTDASADDPFALEDADELLVENETEVAAEPVRPRRRRTSEPPAGGSSLASLFGIACLIGGVVLNALEAQGKVPTGLTTYGLQPATLFVAGAIALGATMVPAAGAREPADR